ncbi:MAG: 2-C-methyl-D-erythritol 2,4-cyclodiphosphate synthase [archaeon]
MTGSPTPEVRIGLGVDSHAFETHSSERKLVIGGVVFLNHFALVGDSDGDVVLHALFNAIHSALGDRGLGFYFSKKDMVGDLTNSENILKKALQTLNASPYRLGNVSLTLECLTPRIEPQNEEIKHNLSRILGIPSSAIGLTSTSGDHLTRFGDGKGIYCQAQVLLYKK